MTVCMYFEAALTVYSTAVLYVMGKWGWIRLLKL